MSTDEELMLAFQGGSGEAFTELFQRYRDRIYGFFRRRLQHPSRAEELAQETFVAILKAVERYEPRALFRTYLYGIALNLLAAERRKSGREVAKAKAANPLGRRLHCPAERAGISGRMPAAVLPDVTTTCK